MARRTRIIEVCDQCFCASCWHGLFMCDGAREAGTVFKTARELRALAVEHSDYFSLKEVERVCGGSTWRYPPMPTPNNEERENLVTRLLASVTAHKALQGYDPLWDEVELAADIISRLTAEVGRAREALKPFADIAENDIGADEADQDYHRPMLWYNRVPAITVGDLRRAARALANTAEEGWS